MAVDYIRRESQGLDDGALRRELERLAWAGFDGPLDSHEDISSTAASADVARHSPVEGDPGLN